MSTLRPCVFVAALAVATAGCTFGASSPQASRPTAAEASACRSRADEVYLKQNRDEIYRADTFATGARDAPFAGAGLAGSPSAGLSGRYAREQLLSDCLNGAPGNVGTVQPDVVPPRAATK